MVRLGFKDVSFLCLKEAEVAHAVPNNDLTTQHWERPRYASRPLLDKVCLWFLIQTLGTK